MRPEAPRIVAPKRVHVLLQAVKHEPEVVLQLLQKEFTTHTSPAEHGVLASQPASSKQGRSQTHAVPPPSLF